MNWIENDGRAMAVRDGYGTMTKSRKLSGTSSRGRANQWRFTRQNCCNVPLPHGHGSALPASTATSLHSYVVHPVFPCLPRIYSPSASVAPCDTVSSVESGVATVSYTHLRAHETGRN